MGLEITVQTEMLAERFSERRSERARARSHLATSHTQQQLEALEALLAPIPRNLLLPHIQTSSVHGTRNRVFMREKDVVCTCTTLKEMSINYTQNLQEDTVMTSTT